MLRLDVEVALSSDCIMTESFSDLGADPNQAFRSSLQNFCSGSLHVILSALWGVYDESQVIIEDHNIGNQTWKLHIGNVVSKSAGGVDVQLPNDFMLIFDRLIQQLQLSPSIHWGRLFYANMSNTDNIAEVLLDNQNWVEAESEFNDASWQQLNSFYSHRMFWIMVPQNKLKE